jgi:hypothetical protein
MYTAVPNSQADGIQRDEIKAELSPVHTYKQVTTLQCGLRHTDRTSSWTCTTFQTCTDTIHKDNTERERERERQRECVCVWRTSGSESCNTEKLLQKQNALYLQNQEKRTKVVGGKRNPEWPN